MVVEFGSLALAICFSRRHLRLVTMPARTRVDLGYTDGDGADHVPGYTSMPTQPTAVVNARPPACRSCEKKGSGWHGEVPAAQLKPILMSGRPAALTACRAMGTPEATACTAPG